MVLCIAVPVPAASSEPIYDDSFIDDFTERYSCHPEQPWNTYQWIPEGYYGIAVTNDISGYGRYVTVEDVRIPLVDDKCFILVPNEIETVKITMGAFWCGEETAYVHLKYRDNTRAWLLVGSGGFATWDLYGGYATQYNWREMAKEDTTEDLKIWGNIDHVYEKYAGLGLLTYCVEFNSANKDGDLKCIYTVPNPTETQ
jgi:hypothetical protein